MKHSEHVGSTKVSGTCPKCGGTLQKAGWMLLACTKCGAHFGVFGNSTMDEERNDRKD